MRTTVYQLMQANFFLKNLDKLLSQYFDSLSDPLGDVANIELIVHNSADVVAAKPQAWLNSHVVSSDCYGELRKPRRDNVMLFSDNETPLFGKVLRLFETTRAVGAHSFALLQLYSPIANEPLVSPIFGEVHVQLTEKLILYVTTHLI